MGARTTARAGESGSWLPAPWRRALAVSFVVHAVGLLAIGVGAARRPVAALLDAMPIGLPFQGELAEIPTLIDLATAADTASPPVEVAAPVPPLMADTAPSVLGDRTTTVPEAMTRQSDGTANRRIPAPDRGSGEGRPIVSPAWRRDASTLRERLTDDAETSQASHARTARSAASPQAVRRELRTGEGDAARTSVHQPPSPLARYGVADPDLPGLGATTVEGRPPSALDRVQDDPAPVARTSEPPVADTSRGPLESDQGRRSFDVEARGPVAADDHSSRAASNESRPSITDLTLAAVSGNDRVGRGPSDRPGASALPTRGAAAAPPGVRSPTDGAGEEARTRERLYDRYMRDIRVRVNDALIWPRALAIRLEQGETIVRFVVLPDGTLSDNLHVVKSSGFREFDQAAVAAIRKASPFPPMRHPSRVQPLPVTMPVMFSNPVIR